MGSFQGVSLIIQEKDNRKLLYDDTRFEVKGFLFFKDLHVDLSDREHHIIINSRHAFSIGRTGFELIYSYNMSKDYNRMWKLILNMSFLYFLYCMRRGGRMCGCLFRLRKCRIQSTA